MIESVVDVLIYLYENYMDGESTPPSDQLELREELIQAGFSSSKIEKALQWLDELAATSEAPRWRHQPRHAFRVYTDIECGRLDTDARGLLLFLEQSQILTPNCRELAIDRALALDSPFITVEELKWIVLLVLMNQPGEEAAFTRMEDMVYNENPVFLH